MSTVAIAQNLDGRLEVFALSPLGEPWHAWQEEAGGTRWTSWKPLDGGLATAITVGPNENGTLSAFVLVEGVVQVSTQRANDAAAGWTAWEPLASTTAFVSVRVAVTVDARLELFALGASDGALWHNYQVMANGSWSGWTSLGGGLAFRVLTEVAVVLDGDGFVAFALDSGGNVQTITQNTSSAWGPWTGLGGYAFVDVTAEVNVGGRLEVFALNSRGQVIHRYQVTDDGPWSGWEVLDDENGLNGLTSNVGASGELILFAMRDTQLLTMNQVVAGGTWTTWNQLGAPPSSGLTQIAVTPSPDMDGNLTVFALGRGMSAWYRSQTAGGAGWNAWARLGDVSPLPIDHVVVLMLENRGFDSVLGYLYYPQNVAPRTILPAGGPPYQGLVGFDAPEQTATLGHLHVAGRPQPSVLAADSPGANPGEPYAHVNTQLFGSPLPPPPGTVPTMTGFLQDFCDHLGGLASTEKCLNILRQYTPADLPVLNGLAKAYAVSDAWFSSVPTQTNANRAFSLCGTSLGLVDNGYLPGSYYKYVFQNDSFDTITVWNVLARAGISWGVYYNVNYPPGSSQPYTWHAFPRMQTLHGAWERFKPIANFYEDAAAGRLPTFTYLEPAWSGEMFGAYLDGNDYHPPNDITDAEVTLQRVYEALRSNRATWERTLLVVVFDEHGGTYDHVPPPWGATPPWGPETDPVLPKPRQFGFNFDRYGVRVPSLLASPWIGEQTVVRSRTAVPFDHTSLLASILDWQGFDRGRVFGARVAAAPNFWHVLTEPSPRQNDQAFPAPRGPALGTPIQFGQPFRLQHVPTGNFVGRASRWYANNYAPTIASTGIDLELRGGFGVVTSGSRTQLRSSEAVLNEPGHADRAPNTMCGWPRVDMISYFAAEAMKPDERLWFTIASAGNLGGELKYGDEVAFHSTVPGQTSYGLHVADTRVALSRSDVSTWRITPIPEPSAP